MKKHFIIPDLSFETTLSVFTGISQASGPPEWDGNGKPCKTVSYFVLTGSDAGSTLSFKLVNNITVEVSVYPIEEGC